jgi:hypothetical protein
LKLRPPQQMSASSRAGSRISAGAIGLQPIADFLTETIKVRHICAPLFNRKVKASRKALGKC